MLPKPKMLDNIGVIQFFLALFFVLWLFIFPSWGVYFAWPVRPELSAFFIASGFVMRSFYGYHLWRQKDWYKLRWIMPGNYAFLIVLFVTSWWHINEMNWSIPGLAQTAPLSIFSRIIALIWMFFYTFEGITVFILRPHGKNKAAANEPVPAALSEGPVLPLTKFFLLAVFYLSTAIVGVLFFDPTFANIHWPWNLNAFDARVMTSFVAGSGVWAATMYFMEDWAEIKLGFRGVALFYTGLSVMSVGTIFLTKWWDAGRSNAATFILVTVIYTVALWYAHWQQEHSPKKA